MLEECRLPADLPKALVAAIESIQREDLFPSYEDGLRRILRFLHGEKRTGVFEETFSCLGPDNAGWRLGAWQLDEADTTGENSRSLHAVAKPRQRSFYRRRCAGARQSTSICRVGR